MADGYRVRLGEDIKFFPAITSDTYPEKNKPATAYVSLAESTSVRKEDGTWVDTDPNWYSGVFKGRDAEILNERFQKGDALIVIGTTRNEVYQDTQGQDKISTKLYVNSFGPDAAREDFEIDRTARMNRAAQRQADQSMTQEPSQYTSQNIQQTPGFNQWQPPQPPLQKPPAPPAGLAPDPTGVHAINQRTEINTRSF